MPGLRKYPSRYAPFLHNKKLSRYLVKLQNMASADNLRNSIIDKLLTITNKDYLLALYQLVEKSALEKDTVKLTQEQVLMLQLSDQDIKKGRLISQEQLDKEDLQWLKGR